MRFITCMIEIRLVNMSSLAPIFGESISENSKIPNLSMAYADKLDSKDEIYTNWIWKGL